MFDYKVETLRQQMHQQLDSFEDTINSNHEFIKNDAVYKTRMEYFKCLLDNEIPSNIATIMAAGANIEVVINNEEDQKLVDRMVKINGKVAQSLYFQLQKDLGKDALIFFEHLAGNQFSIKWTY